jgi:hypothetical protein
MAAFFVERFFSVHFGIHILAAFGMDIFEGCTQPTDSGSGSGIAKANTPAFFFSCHIVIF